MKEQNASNKKPLNEGKTITPPPEKPISKDKNRNAGLTITPPPEKKR